MLSNICIGYALVFYLGTASTAEKINITPGKDLRAELEMIVENQLEGDLYRTEFFLNVVSDSEIPNLYVRVNSPTIMRMEVTPQRFGVSINVRTGIDEGFGFTNLQNAHGFYKIIFFSKSPDKMELDLRRR